ncbi:MAG TPA: hypothetical protein VGM62_16730 [Chthoniobacterales bacterium]|jgi:hypothetical protein
MSWSIEEALTDPVIRKPVILVSEFRFYLRDIPTEITTRLYRPLHSGNLIARKSHDISIKDLKEIPVAEELDDEAARNEGEVLHNVVHQMVATYNAARAQGLTPDASWLKPNDDFH